MMTASHAGGFEMMCGIFIWVVGLVYLYFPLVRYTHRPVILLIMYDRCGRCKITKLSTGMAKWVDILSLVASRVKLRSVVFIFVSGLV